MATWSCGHRRASQTKLLGKAADSVLQYGALRGPDAETRTACAAELAARRRPCPACKNAGDALEADRKKLRRGWFAMALVGAALLVGGLVTCSARAAGVPCAPYSPSDGKTCEPPTRLYDWRGNPVCFCPSTRVANR
jgi:hypothetical protein